MEPFTHAFTSIALSQTARNRLPRFGMLMLVAGGIAPDIDSIGYLISPGAFFRMHRVVFHSILGAIILSCALAYLFVEIDKKVPWDNPQKKRPPIVTFRVALIFCAIGVAGHIVLDLISTVGVALFWPFYDRFYGTDLVLNLDFWMLGILVLGLLLPLLIGVVNEEIGAGKKKRAGVSIAAIVTFVLLGGYVVGRAVLRSRAVHLLLYREYHGREADSAQAYPTLTSPFVWRGVVTTDDTMEVITVPILQPDEFENDRSLSYFKPPDTPDLKAAEATPSVKRYMLYAREPFAVTDRREDDYRVEIKDLRFPPDDPTPENIYVRVQFNSLLKERYEKFIYATVFTP